jgi:RNA polymerase sigma-70 factor (ECF subfamily)
MNDDTSWTLIHAAASGDEEARAEFVRRYLPAVRAYLFARWQGGSTRAEVDDAVQEVVLECLRDGGALDTAGAGRVEEFRAFLLGVVRNVALRAERKRGRIGAREEHAPTAFEPPADEATLSTIFDRAWARTLMRAAGELQVSRARSGDEDARRRLELLKLRFEEGLPIRRIAELWGKDPAWVHHEYARARRDFLDALREVVASHHPGSPDAVARITRELLQMTS